MTKHTSSKDLLPTLQRSATHAFSPVQREFNRLFDEMGSSWESFSGLRAAPSMDVVDTKEGLEISVELPGLSRSDVKIAVDEEMLTISGEKRTDKGSKSRNYRSFERSYGEFSRSIYLPHSIDRAKITAAMTDGVLTVKAPKRADAQTTTIEILAA
jgi:HSP20 family protein